MPVYPQPQDDPRALARRLADIDRRLDATMRRRAGNIADPTPPAVDVTPPAGGLTATLLEETPP